MIIIIDLGEFATSLWSVVCFTLVGISGIDCGHLCLKLVDVVLREWRNGFLLPRELDPFCDQRDGVFRAHGEAGVVGHESRLLPSGMMAGVVASDDAIYLPPFQVMQKFLARESYLAHEELVQFVGGCQFFGFSSPSVSSAFCAGLFFFSISGMGKNSPASVITVLYASTSCCMAL